MEKRRQIALAAGVLALAAATTIEPPRADFAVLTHRTGDPAPARFQAVVDLGLASASILVTWTVERIAR